MCAATNDCYLKCILINNCIDNSQEGMKTISYHHYFPQEPAGLHACQQSKNLHCKYTDNPVKLFSDTLQCTVLQFFVPFKEVTHLIVSSLA